MPSKNLKHFKVINDRSKPTVVTLHGYGANGRDLAGLASYPPLDELDYNWIFLEAPLSPPELAAFGGYAWFNLTLSSFGPKMSEQNLKDFYEMNSKEFHKSLDLIENTIWDLDLSGELIIGGFSQGAMMAANVFLKSPSSYSSLFVLSGAPVNYKNWSEFIEPKRIFVSHGRQDQVLPFRCGQDLKARLLETKGLVDENWFEGGHEIPPQILNNLAAFWKSI